MSNRTNNSIYSQPVVKLSPIRLSLLRRLVRGESVVSLNGGAWHVADGTTFSEQCIEALRRAGYVAYRQCGPDVLLCIHLELTAAGAGAAKDYPTPVNPFAGSDYAPVYDAMHRLNRYAIRELTGHERRNLLDAVQNAMNRTADGDKLAMLSGIEREIGLVAS